MINNSEFIEKIIEGYFYLSKTKINELEKKLEESESLSKKLKNLSIQYKKLIEKYNQVTNENKILKAKIRELESREN
ncbi:hypothetical protein [Cetobacterium somerae]